MVADLMEIFFRDHLRDSLQLGIKDNSLIETCGLREPGKVSGVSGELQTSRAAGIESAKQFEAYRLRRSSI